MSVAHPSPGVVRVALFFLALVWLSESFSANGSSTLPKVENVSLQPLAAQVTRVVEALDYLGVPLSAAEKRSLEAALDHDDEKRAVLALQDVLDRHCLVDIHINPESRVRVTQGPARPELMQNGWRTFLVKVRNEAGVTAPLGADSPQAKPVFSRGPDGSSMNPRPPQTIARRDVADRWLDLSMFDKPPLAPTLSGLELEYRIIQLYSRDAGKREAVLGFDVGQGTQDIGFRNNAPILFDARPSVDVTLRVLDEQERPTTASFVIKDALGRVYPSPAKRLAPDFSFHPQIYREDGERVTLAPGDYIVEYTRGPEYVTKRQALSVREGDGQTVTCRLQRWIDVSRLGWYSGDHHVHAAGCLHYETPTIGVFPKDMIRHIVGEGLNVGAILTWGPGYYFQKQFFEGRDHRLSTPEHLMHYDVEVSGFPSSHAGHLVLLRLTEPEYPGTAVIEDWPSWTLPILRWGKAQNAVVGFAHSGWGLEVEDTTIPTDEVPKFDGIGANEYIVAVAHDLVDFISTVDTPAPWELNIWYHTLNAGFRTRISGETDFPCIYGDRVGLGRSYVKVAGELSYDAWVDGIRHGRAYVSDGKSHLLDFRVNDQPVGAGRSELRLDGRSTLRVTAQVAARLDEAPNAVVRSTPLAEKPYWDLERARVGNTREVPVELIVNGQAVATKNVLADGKLRAVSFEAPIARSSWVALRILPSSHTNPIFVLVGGKPIRASRRSAEWCLKAVDQCWRQKAPQIAEEERDEAAKAYEHAREVYRRILAESGTQ
ncbi:MAG: hypothetical protein GEV06_21690 [Luteitalea sp.]|nr:hypothetical protein [Luteitalea sp.]